MKSSSFATSLALLAGLVVFPWGAQEAAGQNSAGEGSGDLLLSGRMELIQFHNFTSTIREASSEKNRFYFNNIFLNLEGGLGEGADFIVEFQPLTSDLYLLGGFLTIAEALEGIGVEGADARKLEISQLIGDQIRALDTDSQKTRFERAQISFYPSERFGIKLGRVRNPFGFWDDFSLFRNLSALKTDPVSLGVSLRRADLGVVAFGTALGSSYEIGVLQGETAFNNRDSDNYKDGIFKLGKRWGAFDAAASIYLHAIGSDSDPSNALGLSYRYRATYNLTLLGEFIRIANQDIDIATRGFYIQSNYDLSDYWLEGLRWNLFFETYDSDLLTIDLIPELNYRFAGTYFQVSTGFLYAYNRKITLGTNFLSGADEEGDRFYKMGLKIDAYF